MSEHNAKADNQPSPPLVSFVAPSGTGKTTLLEGVIAELVSRGHRVGAIKHDAHRIELDTEGKDSWRLRRAGAASTLLMGQDQFAWFGTAEQRPDLADLVRVLYRNVDIVLVEGFRSAGLDSIVVTRPDKVDDRWEPPAEERILATVEPDQVGMVADLLIARFLA